MSDENERTLEASPYRRQQARAHGHVPQSYDLTTSVVTAVGVMLLGWLGSGVVSFVGNVAHAQFAGPAWVSADIESTTTLWNDLSGTAAWTLAPLFGALMIVGVGVVIAQTGFHLAPERLLPNASRVDPLEGLGRLFSERSATRVGFGLLKVTVIVVVAYSAVVGKQDTIASSGALSPAQIGAFLCDLLFWTSAKLAGALVALGVVDYALQRWRHEQSLRMTSQEMREELAEAEGNAQLSSRRKQAQRQLIADRQNIAAAKADVVITSGTGLAIALSYQRDGDSLPRVVAKGAGRAAEQIQRIARENDVAVVEQNRLAQSLFAYVAINGVVPRHLYESAAETLAYAGQLKS
jgi:flagellar biosynthetic protein FlhB